MNVSDSITTDGSNEVSVEEVQQDHTLNDSVLISNYAFNEEASRLALAKMIVLHEYPIAMVGHEGFGYFMNTTQPLFKLISRNTAKSDILKLYDFERKAIMKTLEKNTSRIAITSNLWTSSNQNKGYMSLRAHFIDANWILQSHIVRFIYVPAPHTAEVLSDVLIDSLFDWNLDRKLSTITLDNCTTNDAMIDRIFDKISASSFILKGSLFHMRCCAHIINLVVKDGMSTISASIEKIRESVVYWVATPKREEKFVEYCRHLNIAYSKKLVLDCRTRWNSTYLMLVSAIPYQDVFTRLSQREPRYKCLPSEDDWKMAYDLVDKLKIFYSVTKLFSGTQYPTANVFFPKVCEIRLALNEWLFSNNDMIEKMAQSMIVKFDKYWNQINGAMAIGVVLDPRYKLKLLDYFFPRMYGHEGLTELEKVKKLCEDLVSEYQSKERKRTHAQMSSGDDSSSIMTSESSISKWARWSSNYLQYVQQTSSDTIVKTELDCYLDEPVLLDQLNVKNFDILGYWKNIGLKYPTLQKIARDFLAIPISTVASQSAFSTDGRVLGPNRSRLGEDTLEALICTQDWIRLSFQDYSKGKIKFGTIHDDIDYVDDDGDETQIN